jgi:hypothetical protein
MLRDSLAGLIEPMFRGAGDNLSRCCKLAATVIGR